MDVGPLSRKRSFLYEQASRSFGIADMRMSRMSGIGEGPVFGLNRAGPMVPLAATAGDEDESER